MIKPHGYHELTPRLVHEHERDDWIAKAQELPKLQITHREYGDLLMLGQGAFTPLKGFMRRDDWLGVCLDMRLTDGTFWPIPITLSSDEIFEKNQSVALWHPSEDVCVGVIDVIDCYEADRMFEAKSVYLTSDFNHPGVAATFQSKRFYLGGDVHVFGLGDYRDNYPELCLTPEETRAKFQELGWKTVAAFQTRNPMHRSHEILVRKALLDVDGVMIHSLLGALKEGDVPADIRTESIAQLIKHQFKKDAVFQAGYPLDMRYAGPREALLHAVFRQNYGCSHLIVGRDHAGVSSYYSPFAAQAVFDELKEDDLVIKAMKFDWHVWCDECDDVVSMSDCPHRESSHLRISGTELRARLSNGDDVPETFSRKEVLKVLRKFYKKKVKKSA